MVLQSTGKKNCLVQYNYCYKQFWKLFTFSAVVLTKLLCCSCNVFYSCLRTLKYNMLAYIHILQKIEYIRILEPWLSLLHSVCMVYQEIDVADAYLDYKLKQQQQQTHLWTSLQDKPGELVQDLSEIEVTYSKFPINAVKSYSLLRPFPCIFIV